MNSKESSDQQEDNERGGGSEEHFDHWRNEYIPSVEIL
jgi:hypothetical protein